MSNAVNNSSMISSDVDVDSDQDSTVFGDDDLRAPNKGGGGVAKAVVAAPFKPIINFVKEKRAIGTTKAALSILLLIFAALASLAFAWLVEREERIRFENEFQEFGYDIIQNAHSTTQQVFAELERLSAEITSSALYSQSTFPNVEYPNFQTITERTFNLIPADVIDYSPLVMHHNRREWENYVANNSTKSPTNDTEVTWQAYIHSGQGMTPQNLPGPFVPLWETSSIDKGHEERVTALINFDLLSFVEFRDAFHSMQDRRHGVLSETITEFGPFWTFFGIEQQPGMTIDDFYQTNTPYVFALEPVFDGLGVGNHEAVGVITSMIPLKFALQGALDLGVVENVHVVFRDSCRNINYTFEIDGHRSTYLGPMDLHESEFDDQVVSMGTGSTLAPNHSDVGFGDCSVTLDVYPTGDLLLDYSTDTKWVVFFTVLGMFAFMFMVFCRYDVILQRRQRSLVKHAERTNNLLENFFPSNVHSRLFESGGNNKRVASEFRTRLAEVSDHHGGPAGSEVVNGMYTTKPIADLFPHTTIMFSDIVGFAAWSSQREPTHVFTLLETVFRSFDFIAKEMDVFKVETIGDCYVAVAGLPNPRDDHAVLMAEFSKACMRKMKELVHKMEVTLGPDTGDLSMRFGLHSGPVTAGVLRGEKSRFQLFGDSVNTAARMETTGEAGKIHMSHETAELLITAGHSKWITPRRDLVAAKGKGVMRTYWMATDEETLQDGHPDIVSKESIDDASVDNEQQLLPPKSSGNLNQEDTEAPAAWGNSALTERNLNRLIDWNVDVLLNLLKKVLEKRKKDGITRKRSNSVDSAGSITQEKTRSSSIDLDMRGGSLFMAVQDLEKKQKKDDTADDEEIVIPHQIQSELKAYVTLVSSMYRDHPFHNFEHASHVMLSITKLLNRITQPNMEGIEDPTNEADIQAKIHEYTFGIASDPLLHFAVAFSALIHDVDHAGVPNNQLMKEDVNLSKKYRHKSVAEKHSIRLSWERLMDSDYREFRNCLCPNQLELKRFRNFVVNTVMATDIADKELNGKRKERWRQCFDEWPDDPTNDDIQRKATIVIEHLIQASDVAHTMQHFEVFLKWNKKLFMEMYTAYKNGRSEKDPSEGWYKGELGFYDFYIIPLAKKLGTCGVFGASSDEYLNYAQDNRSHWEIEGHKYVEQWKQLYDN